MSNGTLPDMDFYSRHELKIRKGCFLGPGIIILYIIFNNIKLSASSRVVKVDDLVCIDSYGLISVW